VQILAEPDDVGDTKVLAGGQSLVPLLSLRLAQPGRIVDINRVDALQEITEDAGVLSIGALVRQRTAEHSELVRTACPLMAAAIPHIGHPAIRNRGTVGGSIAHADPAAEMPGICVACDAEIAVTGTAGPRAMAAKDFFLSALTTALAPDEIITEIRLPAWPAGRRYGFEEFALRRGDFAIAAAAVFYDVDAGGRAANAHVGVIGVGDRPARLPSVEAVLNGARVDADTIAKAAAATSAAVTPQDDIHASAAYRRSLVGTMVERALVAAAG
jgi:carbon-monoxide dehydrogenase medium subunit